MLKRRQIINLSLNCFFIVVIIIALIVGNNIAYRYNNEISSLLSPAIVDEAAMEQSSATGQTMSRRIVEEGAVMLKNNGALPLDKSVKQVNVFGWRSVDWIYGSEGAKASGGVAPEDDDFNKNVDIYKALYNYGIQYNRRLYDMYYNFSKPDHQSADLRAKYIDELVRLREPKISDRTYYTDELLDYSKEYSQTAIVVIGRIAGEGMNAGMTKQEKAGPGAVNDNTRHYLEISTEEEALLTYVGANFENVIVLLNVSNPFECGFLETISGIDACMYIGFTGTRGADALPKLLYGEVSPSGRTADTFPYDLFTNPGSVFLSKKYTDNATQYFDQVENVYIGYKWYETADAMGYWDSYENGYDGVVQFPFGYGLSYNTYEWTLKGFYLHDDELEEDEEPEELEAGGSITDKTKIDIVVNVKNTGDYPGRDVVEVYLTPPYYDGEIEKSAVNLVGFNKTGILEPGADEDVTITVDAYDFASYDCYGLNNKGEDTHTGWELDAGTYTISLRTDSHSVKPFLTESEAAPVAEADGEEETQKPVGMSYDFTVDALINIDVDPVTGAKVDNLFTGAAAVDAVPIDGKSKDGSYDPEIPWFTRSAFPEISQWTELNARRPIAPDAIDVYKYTAERASAWDSATIDEFGDPITAEKPTWGAKNGLKLAENGIITELGKKLGADYDAEEWDKVLDQVTISEFTDLVNGYYGSKEVNSVGKPKLRDYDGPAQIKGFIAAPRGTGYPTMVTIAQTWNPNLAYEFGKAFGDDMKSVGVMGVWGWSMDNHRSPFYGRNHESPGEDAYLAGRMITNAVKGLNTRGRYCFLKHFAAYGIGDDSIYGSGGGNIWMTEQSLRENYIRQFRMAFVEGGALGCMTTYQGLGAEHSETTVALLTGVLRKEWKFKGAITTDYIANNSFMDGLLRCGGNFGMGVSLGQGKFAGMYSADSSERLQQRMRESVKQILYMWLHADYNEQQYLLNPDVNDAIITTSSINTWSWWQPLLSSLTAIVSIGCAMWLALVLISIFGKSAKKGEERALAAATAGGEGLTVDTETTVAVDGEPNERPETEQVAVEQPQAERAEALAKKSEKSKSKAAAVRKRTAANSKTATAAKKPATEKSTEGDNGNE